MHILMNDSKQIQACIQKCSHVLVYIHAQMQVYAIYLSIYLSVCMLIDLHTHKHAPPLTHIYLIKINENKRKRKRTNEGEDVATKTSNTLIRRSEKEESCYFTFRTLYFSSEIGQIGRSKGKDGRRKKIAYIQSTGSYISEVTRSRCRMRKCFLEPECVKMIYMGMCECVLCSSVSLCVRMCVWQSVSVCQRMCLCGSNCLCGGQQRVCVQWKLCMVNFCSCQQSVCVGMHKIRSLLCLWSSGAGFVQDTACFFKHRDQFPDGSKTNRLSTKVSKVKLFS